ncbi:MAG: hypothetical protein KY476_07825 [Planctomycetes bacterium]|nr:hypothetical protein [Planctomycetota bacterium]
MATKTTETSLTAEEQQVAQGLWAEFQQQHDLSDRKGEIAGIDPKTGHIWIGEWFTDVVAQRDAAGVANPLWFERIGFPVVIRKGGHR